MGNLNIFWLILGPKLLITCYVISFGVNEFVCKTIMAKTKDQGFNSSYVFIFLLLIIIFIFVSFLKVKPPQMNIDTSISYVFHEDSTCYYYSCGIATTCNSLNLQCNDDDGCCHYEKVQQEKREIREMEQDEMKKKKKKKI